MDDSQVLATALFPGVVWAHALGWIIRMLGLQLGSNLLGRPAIQNKVVTDLLEEHAALNGLAPTNAGSAAQPAVLSRDAGSVDRSMLPAQFNRRAN